MKTSDCAALSAHSQLAPTPENLTHLLEVVSEAVIVVHRNSGRLLAANTNACTLYGYPRHVLMDMRYPDLATETKSVVAIFSERREHVPLRYHRRSDGRHFPVEMSLRWAGREPDDYAFIAIRDVSELFRRERQDKSDGQRYQALVQSRALPALSAEQPRHHRRSQHCGTGTLRLRNVRSDGATHQPIAR
jgi:PAS domain S-box-containing protein